MLYNQRMQLYHQIKTNTDWKSISIGIAILLPLSLLLWAGEGASVKAMDYALAKELGINMFEAEALVYYQYDFLKMVYTTAFIKYFISATIVILLCRRDIVYHALVFCTVAVFIHNFYNQVISPWK